MSQQEIPKLEDLFESIEEVIAKMEEKDVTLEESFSLYQSGIEKLKSCNEILDGVEKKMQMMNAQGELQDF